MNDLAQTLWQEFATESDEHLVALEPLLVRLGTPDATADDVARAFRAFHSLKGLARAMAIYGMEATAHRAENLLGLVRDRGVAMTAQMLDVLLDAVDCLRKLRDSAVSSRADAPAPAPLLQRLDTLFEAAGGTVAKPSGPPKASPTTSELSEDREMLDLFIELLQTRLPELAAAFDADAAKRTDLLETLDTLENAAGVMQFEQFSETLHDFHGFLSAQPLPLDPPARRSTADRIAQVELQARLLSEVAGGDTGVDALTRTLGAVLGDDQSLALADLSIALGELEGAVARGANDDVARNAGGASAIARAAQSIQQCVAATRSVGVLLLVEDVCSRITTGQLAPTQPLAAVMQHATRAIAACAETGHDIEEKAADELTEAIRKALEPDLHPGENEELDAALAGLKGRPEMLEVLSAANVGELAAGIAAGAHAYEMMLFLEGAPALGQALVDWLNAASWIISNRTVLTNGQSWFDFLVLSQSPPEAFRDALLQRDPERRCVKSLRQVGGEMLLGDDSRPTTVSAATAPTQAPAPGAGAESRNSTVLRVQSEIIDRFMTQIGEIRIAAAELTAVVATRPQQDDIAERVRGVETDLRRLQTAALELRVVPIDTILNRFPRVVRTLAQEQGKNVRLTIEGRDVRVDKSMIDLLADPLMHMVRNAVDHGLELPDDRTRVGKPAEASLTLRAIQRGGEVHVQVVDDGRGLDETRILEKAIERGLTTGEDAGRLKPHELHRFIFAPGFSTAAKITETSGRGVGMDVVMTAVQQLGGDIDVDTSLGKGTTFTLRMPLSAALQTSLLIRVNGQTFGIAERFISSVLEVPMEDLLDISGIGGQASVDYKGVALPVYWLADLLWHDAANDGRRSRFLSIVVISNGRETIGVAVDRIRRRQELFLKDLHPLLAACPTVSGAAVLADGRVVLLLDPDELIQLARAGAWRGAPAAETVP